VQGHQPLSGSHSSRATRQLRRGILKYTAPSESILIDVGLTTNELVGLLIATSFAAGLNVYATVATLGLLTHAGVLVLPPPLHLLANWWVILASGVLFLVEFFADKVPLFDLLWNALQTFVRVPVAALIAYGATSQLSPGKQLLAVLFGGAIALAAHGGKVAARAAVTSSPEPFSNVVLSLGEDALAVLLTTFATRHPYSAAAIVAVFVAIIVLLTRSVMRALRNLFRDAAQELKG
jgi:Domain of unknown function (DUF4126)